MEDQKTTPSVPESSKFRSSRHENGTSDDFDINQPRLGRRESEPYSWEITYLHDVLATNFPNSCVIWDLHHYFACDGEEYDPQFDISYFSNFQLPLRLGSYRAAEYGNRIPDLVINILSKSTYRNDIGENVDICRKIKIPVYIVFTSHPIGSNLYRPPFLRVYLLQPSGKYESFETNKILLREGNPLVNLNSSGIIDTAPYLPFNVGLIELQAKYVKNASLYRLVFIDRISQKILYTQLEKEKLRANQEKQRADELEQKLKKLISKGI